MPDLLHEYWENEEGGDFGPVKEQSDKIRPALSPNARLVFSLYAASWHQAMQLYYDRLDYGDYLPADGVADHVYTDEEKNKQDRYLQSRNLGPL